MSLKPASKQFSENAMREHHCVLTHANLVNKIARHLMARLGSHIQYDDLIQTGMMGLLEAAKKYDERKGASFETFASIRIRGAMLDEVRRHEWAPRSLYKHQKDIQAATQKLEQSIGRKANDREIAEELDLNLSEYQSLQTQLVGTKMMEWDKCDFDGENDCFDDVAWIANPLDNIQKIDFQDQLAKAIESLPKRERLVLSLYYHEELNLKEIGQVMGVSESRVCQIQAQAMLHLQSSLQGC